MSDKIKNVVDDAANDSDVFSSARKIVTGVAQQFLAVKDDPSEVEELANALINDPDSVLDAVTANTDATLTRPE